MSKKANTTMIGAFVVGAALLAVATIVIFGSGKYFTKKYQYVAYFSGSAKGLNIGAPVLFRGVKVGQVTDILMEFDARGMAFRIPVIIQLVEKSTHVINAEYYEGFEEATQDEFILDLINRGLRAQLAPQSFITGLLYVKLEFFPESDGTLTAAETLGSDIDLAEIPTVLSDMEALARTFENLPFEQIAANIADMTNSIDRLVSSPQLPAILNSIDQAASTFNLTMIDLRTHLASVSAELKKAIKNTNYMLGNINQQVDPLSKGFQDAAHAATGAMNQARDTLSLEKGPGADLVADLQRTFQTAAEALEQADTTLQSFEQLSSQDSEVVFSLTATLEEIALAARSIRAVADYLERHPESLLRGKGGKGGN